jgi:hypothetical protein
VDEYNPIKYESGERTKTLHREILQLYGEIEEVYKKYVSPELLRAGAGCEAAPRGRPLLLTPWAMRQAGTLRFPRRWRATCSARKTFMSD